MRAQEQLQPLSITEADAKMVIQERRRMMASIERYLSESQREAIQKKLEEEKRLILGMIKSEKGFQAVPEKSPLVLNQTYFKRKTIDNNIFE